VHGINERLSVEGMATLVQYFYNLLQRWSTPEM
jgi:acetylornithine deacetylase/succinyl-diaminopimelate desuccinylase-like protein